MRIPLLLLLGVAAGACATSPAADQGAPEPPPAVAAAAVNDCRLATSGDSPVARACAEGGVDRAKQVMKEMLRQGRAAGLRLDCADCHGDHLDYGTLTTGAPAKFKQPSAG